MVPGECEGGEAFILTITGFVFCGIFFFLSPPSPISPSFSFLSSVELGHKVHSLNHKTERERERGTDVWPRPVEKDPNEETSIPLASRELVAV